MSVRRGAGVKAGGGGRRGARTAAAPARPASARTAAVAAAKSARPRPALTPKRMDPKATCAFASVRYLGSLESAEGLPHAWIEVALIGRSNVGKSSLLNALCGSAKLARTSRQPGRTQRVHLFEARDVSETTLVLADLPGYGYAAAGAHVAAGFGPMIERYLAGRAPLRLVLLLWDVRRDPDEEFLGFLLWLRERGREVRVVATKCDEIGRTRLGSRLQALQRAMELSAPLWPTSSRDGDGVEGLRKALVALAAGQGRDGRG